MRVLGTLEVVGVHGPVTLPGRKHRRLLAALVLADGRPCSVQAVIDAVWGAAAPASARKLVHLYVSQLRKVLPDGVRIESRPAGYALALEGDILDSARFVRLAGEAAASLAGGNPHLALSLAEQADGLWRGTPFTELQDEEIARVDVHRLEEIRRGLTLDRLDALLQLGRHERALPEALALADSEAVHDRAQALAMIALYRADRQADALDRYALHRRRLDEELGLEPSAALRELQRQILRQDPTLHLPSEASTSTTVGTLPVAATSLVGRERELEQLKGLLARRDARLLVLTGAGGSGKTRLALEAARRAAPAFANGATLVELARLRDPSLVVPTIAQALELHDVPGQEPLETLVDGLRTRELLLVVDNVEHVRTAATALVELLARAPRLCVLVTSRVVLHVSGEHVFPVAPLAEHDAVELFRQRARHLQPSFALDAENDQDVHEICRRLDGLPLAIELAAARIGALTPRALRERLDRRLSLLTRAPRDLPDRQQTLRETIDWSVGLLTDAERRAYARLAVLPAGAGLDCAEAVCGADLDILAGLVDHNMIRRTDASGEPRFGMLETIREHAYELLGSDAPAVERAAARWLATLVDDADIKGGPTQAYWMARLDADIDNIRAAIGYASAHGDSELALRLAGGMYRYWWIRGLVPEGLHWIRDAIASAGPERTAALARALQGGAGLAYSRGDHETATAWAAEAVAIARATASTWDELAAETVLGLVACARGEYDDARDHHRRSADLKAALGIEPLVEKMNLAGVENAVGNFAEAARLFEELLVVHRRNDSPEGKGLSLLNLGLARYRLGEIPLAETCFEESEHHFAAIAFEAHVAHARQGRAACAMASGRPLDAATLLGSAARRLEDLGWSDDDFDPDLSVEAERNARRELGDTAFDLAYETGRAERQAP